MELIKVWKNEEDLQQAANFGFIFFNRKLASNSQNYSTSGCQLKVLNDGQLLVLAVEEGSAFCLWKLQGPLLDKLSDGKIGKPRDKIIPDRHS